MLLPCVLQAKSKAAGAAAVLRGHAACQAVQHTLCLLEVPHQGVGGAAGLFAACLSLSSHSSAGRRVEGHGIGRVGTDSNKATGYHQVTGICHIAHRCRLFCCNCCDLVRRECLTKACAPSRPCSSSSRRWQSRYVGAGALGAGALAHTPGSEQGVRVVHVTEIDGCAC